MPSRAYQAGAGRRLVDVVENAHQKHVAERMDAMKRKPQGDEDSVGLLGAARRRTGVGAAPASIKEWRSCRPTSTTPSGRLNGGEFGGDRRPANRTSSAAIEEQRAAVRHRFATR